MTPRRFLGATYERCAAPLGSRPLARMLRQGLPAALAGPLEYLVRGRVAPDLRRAQAQIEAHRAAIAAVRQPVPIDDWRPYGLPESPTGEAPPGPRYVPGRWLAQVASVPPRWGQFLRLCADAHPGPMIELGACIGISGAYLASSPSCERFVSLEGSPSLARLAQHALNLVSSHATVNVGSFDAGLERLLSGDALSSGLSLAYLDGDHEEASTLRYVQRLAPVLRQGALVVLDDIYFNSAMWRAWCALRVAPGFSAVVDVGRFGLLVRDGVARRPVTYDFARYTGWWRVRATQR